MKDIKLKIKNRIKKIIKMMKEVYPGIYVDEYRVSQDMFDDDYIIRGSAYIDKVKIGFYFMLFMEHSDYQFTHILNDEIKPKFKKKTDIIIKNAKKEGKNEF